MTPFEWIQQGRSRTKFVSTWYERRHMHPYRFPEELAMDEWQKQYDYFARTGRIKGVGDHDA